MLLFKNLAMPEDKPMGSPEWGSNTYPYITKTHETWESIEATTPVSYREVPLQQVYQLTNTLEALKELPSINLNELPNMDTLFERLTSLGISDPEELKSVLTKEYTVQASLVFYLGKLMSSLPRNARPEPSYIRDDFWLTSRNITPLFSFLLMDSNMQLPDKLTHTLDVFKDRDSYLDEEGHRVFNFILARQARTLEILLSNPELIVSGVKNYSLQSIITAIYLKWSINHDEYYTLDYFMGLIKTTAETIKNSPLNSYIITAPNKVSIIKSLGVYNNTSRNQLGFLYEDLHSVWGDTRNYISVMASLMMTMERMTPEDITNNGALSEITNNMRFMFSTEEEYRKYFLDYILNAHLRDDYVYTENWSGRYRFRTQDTNPDLPEVVLTLTVRDSREMEIPIFIGTHEDIDLTILTPSTTKVMDYLRNLYGMEKPDPFLHYGEKTRFLVSPENVGFLPTLVNSLGYGGGSPEQKIYSPTQTLDIRTYLEEQPPSDKPSVYNSWYYALLSSYVSINSRTIMEHIYEQT